VAVYGPSRDDPIKNWVIFSFSTSICSTNRPAIMSNVGLLSLVLSLYIIGVNAGQIQPTQVLEVEPIVNPVPTPRAVMAEEDSKLIDRQYYNTICGYAAGDLSNNLSLNQNAMEMMLTADQTIL